MSDISLQPLLQKTPIAIPDCEHPAPFQCNIEILPHQSSNEVDHVNNIEYIRWIDKAAQLHCDATGWDRNKLLSHNIMWFVARHEIDYRAEATSQDTLLLSTWVEDVRRVKSWRSSVITRMGSDPTVVCTCRTLWVLVDLESRRPIAVPEQMAEDLQPITPARIAT